MPDGEKTEKPTGKKLNDARNKGDIPKSQDLNSLITLMFGGLCLYLSSGHTFREFKALVNLCWGDGFRPALSAASGEQLFLLVLQSLLLMCAPVVLPLMVVGIAANVVQMKGIVFSTKNIFKMDFNKFFNPVSAFSKYFSSQTYVDLLKSLAKLIIIGYVVYSVIRDKMDLISGMIGLEIPQILATFANLVFHLFLRLGLLFLAFSVLDFIYQKWNHIQKLKMTKQEVKDEAKQAEGDPKVKGKIKSMQMKMVMQRMMSQVPDASVVVTNPTHFAVALKYRSGMAAPVLVAKGADHIAKKIIKIARESRVPVVQNPPLARALYHQVKLDETIPVSLYKAVAKILAYIYQQRGRV